MLRPTDCRHDCRHCPASEQRCSPGAIATFERCLAVLDPGRDLPLRPNLLLAHSIAAGLVGDEERATNCYSESWNLRP